MTQHLLDCESIGYDLGEQTRIQHPSLRSPNKQWKEDQLLLLRSRLDPMYSPVRLPQLDRLAGPLALLVW